jgi:Kef-type K+ transport system membrane component KefB
MGSVLGYLIAGIVIGPVLGLVGAEVEELRHFAEFGVVMMLFIVGLELEPRTLWDAPSVAGSGRAADHPVGAADRRRRPDDRA